MIDEDSLLGRREAIEVGADVLDEVVDECFGIAGQGWVVVGDRRSHRPVGAGECAGEEVRYEPPFAHRSALPTGDRGVSAESPDEALVPSGLKDGAAVGDEDGAVVLPHGFQTHVVVDAAVTQGDLADQGIAVVSGVATMPKLGRIEAD